VIVRFAAMRFTLSEAGSCSLCNEPRTEQRPLVEVPNRRFRICNDCVEFCLDIIREDQQCRLEPPEQPRGEPFDPAPMVNRVIHLGADPETMAQVREVHRLAALPRDELLAELARRGPPTHYACSVCDAPRLQVRKLISGPSCHICDRCVAAAAAGLR